MLTGREGRAECPDPAPQDPGMDQVYDLPLWGLCPPPLARGSPLLCGLFHTGAKGEKKYWDNTIELGRV